MRKDGRGAHGTLPDGENLFGAARNGQAASSLRLAEVAVLSNEDYRTFDGMGYNSSSNNTPHVDRSVVLEELDISTSQRNFLDTRAVSRTVLNHDYALSPKTLNSFNNPYSPPSNDASDIYAYKEGKLTLQSISYYGAGSGKVDPDNFKAIGDYACVGQPFEFDVTGEDADGDSLVYFLTTPFLGSLTRDNPTTQYPPKGPWAEIMTS